jgi:hypothetical protein
MYDLSTNVKCKLRQPYSPGLRFFAAIVASIAGTPLLNAADIKQSLKYDEVVLEGTIVSGDYDKLLSFVDDKEAISSNQEVRSIYLASPGGSVIEAIKIGRLVRALKMETVVPAVQTSSKTRNKAVEIHKLTNPEANYMCVSACFIVYVAGVSRDTDLFNFDGPILGIHRPYLTDHDLRTLSGDQAIASATGLRTAVESYLKEMSVPAKYAELMFSVPKDDVRWISNADYETDLEGIIPELKDWVGARCDPRTTIEKAKWEALKHKQPALMTEEEKSISKVLVEKMSQLRICGDAAVSDLSHQAHLKMFAEPDRSTVPKPTWWQFWK